jgi:hypothetical protein
MIAPARFFSSATVSHPTLGRFLRTRRTDERVCNRATVFKRHNGFFRFIFWRWYDGRFLKEVRHRVWSAGVPARKRSGA